MQDHRPQPPSLAHQDCQNGTAAVHKFSNPTATAKAILNEALAMLCANKLRGPVPFATRKHLFL